MACMKHIPVDIVMKYSEELLKIYGAKPAKELSSHIGDYQCRVNEL